HPLTQNIAIVEASPATTECHTLSLHDALPIWFLQLSDGRMVTESDVVWLPPIQPRTVFTLGLNYADHAKELSFTAPKEPLFSMIDRKSTRLNSSHVSISYAVFCLQHKQIIQLI